MQKQLFLFLIVITTSIFFENSVCGMGEKGESGLPHQFSSYTRPLLPRLEVTPRSGSTQQTAPATIKILILSTLRRALQSGGGNITLPMITTPVYLVIVDDIGVGMSPKELASVAFAKGLPNLIRIAYLPNTNVFRNANQHLTEQRMLREHEILRNLMTDLDITADQAADIVNKVRTQLNLW